MPWRRLRLPVPGTAVIDGRRSHVIAHERNTDADELRVDVPRRPGTPHGAGQPWTRERTIPMADFTAAAPAVAGFWRHVPGGSAVHWHEACPVGGSGQSGERERVTEDEAFDMLPCRVCSALGAAPLPPRGEQLLRSHGLPVPKRTARSLDDVVASGGRRVRR